MFRAKQNALNHATNQGLIEIRESEINYYVNVFSEMGVQAALLGGFAYDIFTQNIKNTSNSYVNEVYTAYFIVVSLTIASALHVIINTMLLQVLGPGLALNGPIGSMARAAEGMRAEQDQVLWSFGLMVACFAISTMLDFWVVMAFWPALVSTGVFLVSIRIWLNYSKRMFLRFYWDKSNNNTVGKWGQREEENYDDDDDEPTIEGKLGLQLYKPNTVVTNPMQQQRSNNNNHISSSNSGDSNSSVYSGADNQSTTTNTRTQVTNQTTNQSTTSSNGFSYLSRLWKPTDTEIRESLSEVDRFATKARMARSKDIAMEGYLTKRGVSRTGLSGKFVKEPWERRYFVMNNRGQMYYYKNRQDFRTSPIEGRIKARPIELESYYIQTGNNENNNDDNDDGITVTTNAKTMYGSPVPTTFQLVLRPREGNSRHWHLRCDTEEVLAEWVTAMGRVSPSSFPVVEAE